MKNFVIFSILPVVATSLLAKSASASDLCLLNYVGDGEGLSMTAKVSCNDGKVRFSKGFTVAFSLGKKYQQKILKASEDATQSLSQQGFTLVDNFATGGVPRNLYVNAPIAGKGGLCLIVKSKNNSPAW